MKELILNIATMLVDHPDQVQIREIDGQSTRILELHVAKEDIGKVIGKHGRTARAMRVLLGAAAGKAKKRTLLEIVE